MASPVCNNDEEIISEQNSMHQSNDRITRSRSSRAKVDAPDTVVTAAEIYKNALSDSTMVDAENEVVKSASSSARKRKKAPSRIKGKRYPLRSALGSGRVLRSMSKAKVTTQPEPVNTPVNPVPRGRKKRRNIKKASNDEFSLTRKRVRYLLTRINYEQNLIDAYAGEGWKGQSAEKLRPEKELERAKTEILRRKLKIRELFQHLDSLSSKGRFEESLFDSEGEIDSEDIFCAICRLKDVSADNDIVLCDGICDRGFHQKCLNPPLLSEDIPLGDEGWLCPACDCKDDCIELLNEFQARNMSIEDSWEKVFPESVCIANGDKQHDDFPSDDSDDNDYDPAGPETVVGDQGLPHSEESEQSGSEETEQSDSEESEFTSESEDIDASNSNKQNEDLEFPSDDSEDDDFDPDALDLDKCIQKDGSSSDESDFTSDSDEFCNELKKTVGGNEDSASSLQNLKPSFLFGEETSIGVPQNSELSMLKSDLSQENVLVPARRQIERLDYKKLYDETYGKSSTDSSGDEDWSELSFVSSPNGGQKRMNKKESDVCSKGNAQTINRRKISKNLGTEKNEVEPSLVFQGFQETTPRKTDQHACTSSLVHGDGVAGPSHTQKSDTSGNKPLTPGNRSLGEIARQKLYASFQENQYPTRLKKESLAQELELTYRQVDKWFGNVRHSVRVSTKGVPSNGTDLPDKDTSVSNSHGVRNGNLSDGNVVQSSSSKGSKRKNPAATREKKQVVSEESKDVDTLDVDKDRQKAVARELRKMKQGR